MQRTTRGQPTLAGEFWMKRWSVSCGRAAGTIVSLGLMLVAADARGQFQQSDLTGTWSSYVQRDNPSPGANAAGYKAGTVSIDGTGAVTGGSDTDHTGVTVPHTGGQSFAENGIEINFARLKKIKKPQPGDRYGFLLQSDRLQTMYEGRKDFLTKSSSIAIDFLSTGDKGYFLMIESSQIDWAGHGNQVQYMINEMNDFEQTVKSVMDYAEADGNTLVIVTADHETGGFTLGAAGENGYGADYSVINPTFASTNHSAALVPVLAYGPGAENFIGIYENTEIFHKLVSLLNVK